MNRGLIEARRARSSAERLLLQLPRFMNRGLIEALLAEDAGAEQVRTSPIHESGPH